MYKFVQISYSAFIINKYMQSDIYKFIITFYLFRFAFINLNMIITAILKKYINNYKQIKTS